METRTAPLIGGRYRIGGLLGEGGMARVFAAYDERLERPAAVKILRAETLALPGMRQRFQQEAFIAARLVHPHIVAVLDFGEDHSSSYLVMERLPGTTLRDEIVARGPLPAGRVALVMSETLAALAAAHGRGVLHRDIKPSNILLQQDGHTKITDFGIAKSFDSRTDAFPLRDDMTMTGVVLGTPGYLAPERRAGFPATVQSDVYAVGAVMVEALTGQRLAPGAAPADALPPPLRDIACRALAVDPHQRFSSADDMLRALGPGTGVRRAPGSPRAVTATIPVRTAVQAAATTPASGTAHLTSPPAPPRQRDTRTRTRRRRRLVLAAVGAAAVGSALFLLLDAHAPSTLPTASTTTHHVAQPQTQAVTKPSPTTTPTTDAESSAITTLAASLASGGYPGDGALASALQATAAQPPGADRQSAAQLALSLAGVLLDGGGITTGQYQDVITVLQPTGATVTTTTVTPPTVPQPLQTPFFGGHDHGHGPGHGPGGGQG